MFEFEVDYKQTPVNDTTSRALTAFSDSPIKRHTAISPLLWEEHCTECAMPSCYSTCDIYESRKDGKCRRFTNGISKLPLTDSSLGYVVKIDFKQWASLMAKAPLKMITRSAFESTEKKFKLIENVARNFPDGALSIRGRKGLSSRLARRIKVANVDKLINVPEEPSHFVAEIYNPTDKDISCTFTIRADHETKKHTPYQNLMVLTPGFHRIEVPYESVAKHLENTSQHYFSFVPNDKDCTLFFGLLGFIRYEHVEQKVKPIKVIAWDLDHTLWDGILVEATSDKPLELKPEIKHILHELNRRGIVNTILSKNDNDNAMAQLTKFGLDDYFVFPEISWEPKSIGMKKIISNFNVHPETIAFVDDTPFEREEVASQHPNVKIFKHTEYDTLLNLPEFTPQVSAESSKRKDFYKNQQRRQNALVDFDGDYFEFVRSCGIQLTLSKIGNDNIDRIHELVQRTNQMNFSGNRYSKTALIDVIAQSNIDGYQLECRDKFGDYGTVGFALVDTEKLLLQDLAFSCRVQSKRVEHEFITWLVAHYAPLNRPYFSATYNQTDRNAQSGKVFNDLAFEQLETGTYGFNYQTKIESLNLIDIKMAGVK